MRANDEAVNGTPTKMGLHHASQNYARRMGECVNERYYLWLLDSGSTSHMTRDEFMCDDMREDGRQIGLADKNGKMLMSKGISDVIVRQSGGKSNIRLKNVLYVPNLNSNLLSVAKIIDQEYNVNFNRFGAIAYKGPNDVKMTTVRIKDAYYARSFLANERAAATSTEADIWHKRMGHAHRNNQPNEERKTGTRDDRRLEK